MHVTFCLVFTTLHDIFIYFLSREAAEHFLSALNLQNAGRGPQGMRSRSTMSSNIWSTLRTVMTLLQRPELYDAIDRRDLDLLNKEFGMEA